MQHTLKVENIPTRHHRGHNVLGTIQASFLAKFKTTSNKLGKKKHPPQCSKDIMHSAIYYRMGITN